jgi:hypothetical protein
MSGPGRAARRLAALLGGVLFCASAAAAPGDFALPEAPGAPVVSLLRQPGEAEAGASWLHVYADGRVRVHHGEASRRAGDFEGRLAPPRLRALVASLLARGVAEFDPASVRAQQRAADAARAGGPEALHARLDEESLVLELRLARVELRDGSQRSDLVKRIAWSGLRGDERRYPGVAALRDLAAAVRELEALFSDSALAPETP